MTDSAYIHTVTSENFDAVVLEESRNRPVLVDFWAAWCNPCQMLMPILARLADEYQGRFLLAKIDTEDQQELAARFGIRSLPTVQLFRDGQPVDQFMGALPETQIRAFLEQHLPRESDKTLAEAQILIDQGAYERAEQLIESAIALDENNPSTLMALAKLRMLQGDPGAAMAVLAELPASEQDKPEVKGLQAQLHFDALVQDAPSSDQLEKSLALDPADSEARHQLAARRVTEGDHEAALETLLTLMRRDRQYADDAARKDLLLLFDLLGPENPLVSRFRTLMFNALH